MTLPEVEIHISTPYELTTTPTGMDSMIMSLPPGLWAESNGLRVLIPNSLAKLAAVAHAAATDLNEKLHHADFWATRDPEVAAAVATVHDCDECRQGAAAAREALRKEPDKDLLVGLLYWAPF